MRDPLSRRIRLDALYDLYGPLLTERQRKAFEMHDQDDLSLSEIAESLGTSRQGVHDLVQRARERLEKIESLVEIAARDETRARRLERLRELLVPALDALTPPEREEAEALLHDINPEGPV